MLRSDQQQLTCRQVRRENPRRRLGLGPISLLLTGVVLVAAFVLWRIAELTSSPHSLLSPLARRSTAQERYTNRLPSAAEIVAFHRVRDLLRDSSPPVYPYSVIPGGVLTSAELRNRITADPVVAAHYRNFNTPAARIVKLRRSVQAYVSYRRQDKVYWTTKHLLLAKGEAVLTDGKFMARARCGNRVVEDRKLIPPEELSKDPEEAFVTRVLDEPQPPWTPPTLIPEGVDPFIPNVPPSPPPRVLPPPSAGTVPPPAPAHPRFPFFILPTEPAPPGKFPTLGGDPPPIPNSVPEPPISALLLISGGIAIIARLWRVASRDPKK